MIKLESFIQSIQAAIMSANDALMDKNLDVLDNFFEVIEDDEEFQENVNEALTVLNEVLDQDRTPGRQRLTTIREALENVRDGINQGGSLSEALTGDDIPDKLRPQMTTVQFPHKTADGVVMSDVRVPVITLVPLSMTQITEVKFRTDLEIQIEDDDLVVNFPSSNPRVSDGAEEDLSVSSHSVGSLEITLAPHHGTEGLRKIVEGYEKALRAQLPH